MIKENFEPIIGLEIHVELKTKSKMFCGCNADWFGKVPNTLCCPVCLALPGTLPFPNRIAVEWCVMLGLALNCDIPVFSKFDRKNYFYPDLPKGYQISQYDKPFAINGSLETNTNQPINKLTNQQIRKKIRIRRVHMEEDTGKLLHATIDGAKCTLIDFNRSGMPLVEIVTEPDIRSSEEARIFLKKLHQIIRYIGISDADMEKGSMRLEPNISVRKFSRNKNQSPNKLKLPNYKVEVKNINSFNFAKKAIDFELDRHISILEKGEVPAQETRGWDEKKGITYTQRTKEEAHDYRYFPEPDIPPIRWTKPQISKLKAQICELPDKKIKRFIKDYKISEYDATILTDELETADYYENSIKYQVSSKKYKGITPKIIANWIINKKTDITKVTPEKLVNLISQKQQIVQMDDKELEAIIQKVLKANPKAVADFKSGKQQALMFLVGQVMREAKGKAEAEETKRFLSKMLN
ncbi:Asp-tRNA(Asn)/Glu-tRNA(Gln) amidotransferase subunit GatB [Candidatus Gottesmanbacteria bacterium]|nr:Asp-tRNA(Asn)/Glu-tRNA(Gln) amidotransferase subunit GatB [Candidatus Gottesmanbacteria bacterium]